MSEEKKTVEGITGQIVERLDALSEAWSPAKLEENVRLILPDLLKDDEIVRNLRFTADPRLAGSKYARLGLGVSDIEMLHQILTSAKAVGRSSGPSEELENAFKAVSEARYIDVVSAKAADVAMVDAEHAAGRLDTVQYRDALKAIDHTYSPSVRAMDTAESGYGSQLIGAQYASDLWSGAQASSRIFGLIPSFNMTDPTAYLPVEAAPPEMLYVSESTSSTVTAYGTSKTGSNRVTVSAKKFVIHQMWSGEMEEDSIIPYLPFLRGQAQRSIAHYSDSLVLNGDTTNAGTGNINEHDADPTDTDHFLAFDGLRHAALVDNTGNAVDHNGAALTYTALCYLRKLGVDTTYLHDWGHPDDPSDWVYIIDPEGADVAADLDELITVDKFGSSATVLTGQVANIGRNPLIASIAMKKTAADGFVDTADDGTLHQVLAFNRRGYAVGIRRSLKIETERIIESDQNRIVYSLRMGFGRFSPTGAASGIESAAALFNIAA